ncbi:UNKNOWN [Stylonychia lemnae]|uniref:Uncharacterized protein n=1 Tax=Stylonychia lemnae TaxID=5949 RepID=A0A078ABI1_STYLE|nr:UNKNOWN [Stylonychia lemnae]|eukprot:CDW79226.1 UNKNOWN [Stylonychia lemnae]
MISESANSQQNTKITQFYNKKDKNEKQLVQKSLDNQIIFKQEYQLISGRDQRYEKLGTGGTARDHQIKIHDEMEIEQSQDFEENLKQQFSPRNNYLKTNTMDQVIENQNQIQKHYHQQIPQETDSQTERIEFLAGQTSQMEDSSFQMSQKLFQVNKSLMLDELDESQINDIMRTSNNNGILRTQNDLQNGRLTTLIYNESGQNLKLVKNQQKLLIYDSNDVIYEDDVSVIGLPSNRDENRASQGINYENQKYNIMVQKAQITTLNEQFNLQPTTTAASAMGISQIEGQMATNKNSQMSFNENAPQRISQVVVTSQIPSHRYQENTEDDNFSHEYGDDSKFKAMRVLNVLDKILFKRQMTIFNKLHSLVKQDKVIKLVNMVNLFKNKQQLNVGSTFLNIKFYGLQKFITKTYESQRQLSLQKQNTNNKNKFQRLPTFEISDNVSDIMEENIRESDFDVIEKNEKISIIKNSNQLSYKINEQNGYLHPKKFGNYNNDKIARVNSVSNNETYFKDSRSSEIVLSSAKKNLGINVPNHNKIQSMMNMNSLGVNKEASFFGTNKIESISKKNSLIQEVSPRFEYYSKPVQELEEQSSRRESRTKNIAANMICRILSRIDTDKLKHYFKLIKKNNENQKDFSREVYSPQQSFNPHTYIPSDIHDLSHIPAHDIKTPSYELLLSPKENTKKKTLFRHQSPPVFQAEFQKSYGLSTTNSVINNDSVNIYKMTGNSKRKNDNDITKLGNKITSLNRKEQRSFISSVSSSTSKTLEKSSKSKNTKSSKIGMSSPMIVQISQSMFNPKKITYSRDSFVNNFSVRNNPTQMSSNKQDLSMDSSNIKHKLITKTIDYDDNNASNVMSTSNMNGNSTLQAKRTADFRKYINQTTIESNDTSNTTKKQVKISDMSKTSKEKFKF